MEERGRLAYVDLLRVIAVCAVVMVHAAGGLVTEYGAGTVDFFVGNVLDSLSRLGVPVFLMISGALMLDERRPYRLGRRVGRLLLLLFLWSLLYTLALCVVRPLLGGGSVQLGEVLTSLFRGHYHLWYLWTLIGLSLLTPLLRSIVCLKNARQVRYFLLLSLLLFGTAPLVRLLLPLIPSVGAEVLSVYEYVFDMLHMELLGGFTVYYLLGWYLAHTEQTRRGALTLYALGLGGVSVTVLLTQLFPTELGLTYAYEGLPVVAAAAALFVLVKRTYRPSERGARRMACASSLTFGVYAMHILVLSTCYNLLPMRAPFVPVAWGVTLLVCFAATRILSRIPCLKVLVNA